MTDKHNIEIKEATLQDHPIIQNMARFYVYDLSKTCGLNSSDWAIPSNGLYESFDFKNYILDPNKFLYLIKAKQELAGFFIFSLSKNGKEKKYEINEFFILARFQSQGIGTHVLKEIFKTFHGEWRITVIPENNKAMKFWEKQAATLSKEKTHKSIENVTYDQYQPKRVVYTIMV